MPVVPRDRWFICWARGAITPEGWMDKLGSMAAAGVITAPCRRRRDRQDLDQTNLRRGINVNQLARSAFLE